MNAAIFKSSMQCKTWFRKFKLCEAIFLKEKFNQQDFGAAPIAPAAQVAVVRSLEDTHQSQ